MPAGRDNVVESPEPYRRSSSRNSLSASKVGKLDQDMDPLLALVPAVKPFAEHHRVQSVLHDLAALQVPGTKLDDQQLVGINSQTGPRLLHLAHRRGQGTAQ